MREITRPGPERADHVERLEGERPSEGDSLQSKRRLVCLICIELAPDALIYNISGSFIGTG